MRGDHHDRRLPARPRQMRGELPAADAARLPRPLGGGLPGEDGDRAWARAPGLCHLLRPLAPAGQRARAGRRAPRADGLGAALQHAADARGALRRADDGRRPERAQHPARRGRHRLHPRPWRVEAGAGRQRARAPSRRRARPNAGHAPAGRRVCRPDSGCARHRHRHGLWGLHRRGRPGARLEHAGGRVGRHRAQLYVGHDRQPQGRRLPPPWRGIARHRQRRARGHDGGDRLSLDAADVPLQRMVLPLGRLARRRHACVPAPGAGAGHLRRHRRARRHASLRRAHRHVDAARRRRGRDPRLRPAGDVLDRRRAAARIGAGRHGRAGLCRDALLRPDRVLRPRRAERVEGRMGCAAAPASRPA